VCGEPRMLPMLQHIAAACGDVLKINHYQRLSMLKVERDRVLHEGGLKNVAAGDAVCWAGILLQSCPLCRSSTRKQVVCFSRKQVFALKQAIETNTSHKCCVV
jgi:ATP-dependent RNA helicase SUPV3L1/SUV3